MKDGKYVRASSPLLGCDDFCKRKQHTKETKRAKFRMLEGTNIH